MIELRNNILKAIVKSFGYRGIQRVQSLLASFKTLQIFIVLFALTLSVVFSGIATSHAASPGWNNGKIKWMSFTKGMKEAQKTGKPMLVVFEAKWCKICKQYRRQFYKKSVVAMSKNLVMVMVNIEKNRGLQKKYSPDGGYIPRTMAFSPKGYLNEGLTASHPDFKYFIEPKSAAELLNFMKRTAAQ